MSVAPAPTATSTFCCGSGCDAGETSGDAAERLSRSRRVASRRGADELIKRGRVRVNGVPGELNTFVEEGDVVDLDGKRSLPQRLAYVLLHKPAGVVTTARDPHGPADRRRPRRARVRASSPSAASTPTRPASLLLTNDGELAHRLAHPRYEVDKVYEAEVEGEPSDEALRRLEQGVELDDGPTAPAHAPAASARTGRAHDPRGPQAPGEAHARGRRPSGPRLHRSRYAGLDHRGSRARAVARAHRRRGRSPPRRSLVEGEHGQHDVERDERPALERDRLAVAGDLPHRRSPSTPARRCRPGSSTNVSRCSKKSETAARAPGTGTTAICATEFLTTEIARSALPLGRERDPDDVLDRVAGDRRRSRGR